MNTWRDREDRLTTRHYVLALAVAVFLLAVTAVTLPVKASSATPYGGCKEVLQDWPALIDTPGADECRAEGWVIRRRLVVGPHHWVWRSRLPDCVTEDSGDGPCSWNFTAPRADGLKFWRSGPWAHHRAHYVHVGRGAIVR